MLDQPGASECYPEPSQADGDAGRFQQALVQVSPSLEPDPQAGTFAGPDIRPILDVTTACDTPRYGKAGTRARDRMRPLLRPAGHGSTMRALKEGADVLRARP